MPSRLTAWWGRGSQRRRLAEVEAEGRRLSEQLDDIQRELQRQSSSIEAGLRGVESRLAAVEAAIARANADIERHQQEIAAVQRLGAAVEELERSQIALRDERAPGEGARARAAADTFAQICGDLDAVTREVARLSRFVLRTADDRVPERPRRDGPRPAPTRAVPLATQFRLLEEKAPGAFPVWKELLEHNRRSYAGFPVHSCSVEGHPSAALFKSFVNQFLRGDVLDVGCGPQPVPLYLRDFPVDHIHGIDPISTADRHPFLFQQGLAEFLPWDDESFDVVVAATSLDHVLLLDQTLSEIHRVLKRDGDFLVWVAFVADALPYDPFAPDIRPVDEFHLFHFTEEFFEAAVSEWFTVKDKLRVNLEIDHHFYRLAKRAVSASA